MAKKKQKKEIKRLLKAAAANGNLGRREYEKILDAGGKPDRILERAVANKGLTIGSSVVNRYNKGKYTSPRDQFYRKLSGDVFGSGFNVSPIIKQIQDIGRMDPKSVLYIGKRGRNATVLPKKLNIGDTKSIDPIADPGNTTSEDPINYDTGGDFGGFGSGFGDMGVDSNIDSNLLQGGTLGGGEGMTGALGVKSRKSSRKQARVSNKGTSQLNRNSLKIPLNFN